MSKRYGRNQKRKHLEEIARLESEKRGLIVWEQAQAAQREELKLALAAQKAIVKEIVETINEVVHFSALTPPQKFDIEDRGDPSHRLRIARTSRPTWGLNSPPESYMPDLLTVDMWELRCVLESRIFEFEKLVHVLLPGRTAYVYRMSERTWEQLRRGRKLPEVTMQIYREIMSALTEKAA